MRRILVVSHLLDYSGAPLALLSACRALVKSDYSVDLYSLKFGPLSEEFDKLGVKIIGAMNFSDYDLVIFNTSISVGLFQHLPIDLNYIIWLHESPSLFVHTSIPSMVVKASKNASGIFYPSRSLFHEWARYGELRKKEDVSKFIFSPIAIDDYFLKSRLRTERSIESELKIVTIDPVEHFRGLSIISSALEKISIGNDVKIKWMAIGADHIKLSEIIGQDKKFNYRGCGRIPRVQVLKIISEADLYISATAYATQNLGLFEALAYGLPAIVSDIPVHREIKSKLFPGILVYDLFNPDDLMIEILKLMENYEEINLNFQGASSLFRAACSNEVFDLSFIAAIEGYFGKN